MLRAVRWAIGLGLVMSSTSAFAADPDEAWRTYWQALNHVCPAKHLDLLSPADLRDIFDDFKAHAAPIVRHKMNQAERKHCKDSIAGAGCANLGDIEVAEKHEALGKVAATVCNSFAICRDQSDCDKAATATH